MEATSFLGAALFTLVVDQVSKAVAAGPRSGDARTRARRAGWVRPVRNPRGNVAGWSITRAAAAFLLCTAAIATGAAVAPASQPSSGDGDDGSRDSRGGAMSSPCTHERDDRPGHAELGDGRWRTRVLGVGGGGTQVDRRQHRSGFYERRHRDGPRRWAGHEVVAGQGVRHGETLLRTRRTRAHAGTTTAGAPAALEETG